MKDRSGALAGSLAKPPEHREKRGPAGMDAGARKAIAVEPVEPGGSHEIARGRARGGDDTNAKRRMRRSRRDEYVGPDVGRTGRPSGKFLRKNGLAVPERLQ